MTTATAIQPGPATAGSRGGRAPVAPLAIVVLLVAGAVISGFTIWRDIDPFDEGLALQAARRVALGQLPYRDFSWAYGPAQPYLLAGLSKLLGTSLLQWRIVRALCDAAVAAVAYCLVAGRAPRAAAAVTWLAVICEMAEPRSADPFAPALLAVLAAILIVTPRAAPPTPRRLLAAAVLTAAAAAFRLDFALYGGAAILVAVAVHAIAGRVRPRHVVHYVVATIVLGALVYAPFAIADGPGSLYHALVGQSLSTGGYWSLPFPLHFHRPPGAGAAKTAKKALDFYIPLLVVVGFALAIGAAALAVARGRGDRRTLDPRLPALLVLGIGLFAYLVSRADEFHVQPLFVVVVIASGLVVGTAERRLRPLPIASAAVLALLLLHGVANRASALLQPPAEAPLHIAVADGVRVPPRSARAIDAMVRLVQSRTRPGQPIYVLPRRSDLVRLVDPLIYVMTERDNPSRQDYGLLTGAAAQRQIVAMLARVRPRVIVRWTDPTSSAREPNRRGRSSGVHTVDRWVAAHYRLLARLPGYDVLVPAATGPRRARS